MDYSRGGGAAVRGGPAAPGVPNTDLPLLCCALLAPGGRKMGGIKRVRNRYTVGGKEPPAGPRTRRQPLRLCSQRDDLCKLSTDRTRLVAQSTEAEGGLSPGVLVENKTTAAPWICLLLLFALVMAESAGAHVFDTVLNADAVEFCPIQSWRDRAICGTYQLVESNEGGKAEQQERKGRLWVLRVGREAEEEAAPQVKQESYLDVPGVFDIKWSGGSTPETSTLGHAAADGRLYTYRLRSGGGTDSGPLYLTKESELQCGGQPGSLALSLDWSDKYAQQGLADVRPPETGSPRRIAVSLSDGILCIAEYRDGGGLELLDQ